MQYLLLWLSRYQLVDAVPTAARLQSIKGFSKHADQKVISGD